MGAEELERLLKKLERDQYGTTAAMLRAHIEALQREADEMREALRGMLETSDGFDFDQLCKRHDATVVNRIMRARAALSKATGVQHDPPQDEQQRSAVQAQADFAKTVQE
ncbi:MAG: hypothetical protein NW206_19735 [Hyphomonadaceae bacterium]|nr:hypothetical protein [Hyphomonadaceae bacterium]